jgi:hypothetical protein
MHTPAHHANGCFLSHPKGLDTNATRPVHANVRIRTSENSCSRNCLINR